MAGLLLIGVASLGLITGTSTSTSCRATAEGPTFGLGTGMMYFHFTTTCDVPMESITINAAVDGPTQDRTGTKTCLQASSCTYLIGLPYARGTWVWTNDSTVVESQTFVTSTTSASNYVTYNQ